MIKIYHNNRCSKSRSCLTFLKETSQEIQIIDYMNNPPSITEINEILRILNIPAIDLIRKNEVQWKENKHQNLSDDQLVELMATYPNLIERPIVIKDDKGIIARPAEKIFDWLTHL